MAIQSNFPAIKPSLLLDFANTKSLDPRITFTRASTATYYDGVTTSKAEENLILQSQTFDNASWTKSNSTITADSTTAPDGTTTADSLIEDTANSSHLISSNSVSFVSSVYTYSCYVKANTRTKFRLNVNTSPAACYADFDLTAVTASSVTFAGSGFASGTATITSVGNSWYRCTLTWTSSISAAGNGYLVLLNAAGALTYTGDGVSGLYIWGAQLEQRSAVTAYTATTSQPITNYIPVLQTAASGVARFDCNPTTGESLGLLIEEQRTNIATYSAQFDNAAWSKVASSITANTIIAPDGTLTGDKLVEDTSNSAHRFQGAGGVTGAYTFSIYAKAAERTWVALNFANLANGLASFNLSTGVTGTVQSGVVASITSVGNGWYKCSISATLTSTGQLPDILIETSDVVYTYTGNGFSGIYIWGAQLEAGAFATSYIPTVASQVTRSADAASMTGTNFSSWYNQAEGTLYAEGVLSWQASGFPRIANINNGTLTNKIDILATSATSLFGAVTYNNSDVLSQSVTATVSSSNKSAIAYAFNNGAFVVNASSATTDTSMNIPSVSQLNIGSSNSGNFANGTIRKIAYYPLRVTNAQLQALTS